MKTTLMLDSNQMGFFIQIEEEYTVTVRFFNDRITVVGWTGEGSPRPFVNLARELAEYVNMFVVLGKESNCWTTPSLVSTGEGNGVVNVNWNLVPVVCTKYKLDSQGVEMFPKLSSGAEASLAKRKADAAASALNTLFDYIILM